jgi:predicted transcriptional regulator
MPVVVGCWTLIVTGPAFGEQIMGMTGISKSRVSELCEELDEEVERFRNRPLEGAYPYVWVDATYLKARQDGRVVSTGWMPSYCKLMFAFHRECPMLRPAT